MTSNRHSSRLPCVLLAALVPALAAGQETDESVESAFKGLMDEIVRDLTQEAQDRALEAGQRAGDRLSGNDRDDRRREPQTHTFQATHLGAPPRAHASFSLAGSWKFATPELRPNQPGGNPGYILMSLGPGKKHWERKKARGGWQFSQDGTRVEFVNPATCEQGSVTRVRGRLRVEWTINRTLAKSCVYGYDGGSATARVEAHDGGRRMIWEDVELRVAGDTLASRDWVFTGSGASQVSTHQAPRNRL